MPLQTANIIGSGPNGLAAAITLAQRGVAVTVYERNATPGGACATGEITLPGFHHDLGSSVYPLGVVSPLFSSLPLERYGLRWIEPAAPLAHPFDDGSALLLEYSIDDTVARMPGRDVHAWRELVTPTIKHWPEIVESIMRPLRSFPEHPLIMARFGLKALQPAAKLARSHFKDEHMRTLFAGIASHSVLPLTHAGSSAVGLVLAGAAHTTGWPIAAGGAQSITNALVAHLESLGGRVVLNSTVTALEELPAADATLFDTNVEGMAKIAGGQLSVGYRAKLNAFQRGPGVFKMDWALSEPIPWKAKACSRAATVHVGGSLEEIMRSEHAAFYGGDCEKPFLIVVQPSLFDATRAPEGKHTAWAYCHVPTGSSIDRTELVERQMERFAPGFRDTILARRASCAADLAAWNPNLAGGDISGGASTLAQLVARPTNKLYRTSNPALYLCSSSTPPGGGVHGMCGYNAALAALADHRG